MFRPNRLDRKIDNIYSCTSTRSTRSSIGGYLHVLCMHARSENLHAGARSAPRNFI